ncbi:MAG: hypothetical protein K9J17_09775 [Flavobacteriales bacterium]|nr:hypothetical protein [Flavobacteriales bacterium]
MTITSTHVKYVQTELKRLGHYLGPIDGDAGSGTKGALKMIAGLPASWSLEKKLVGFIQIQAVKAGLDPGPFDGIWGQRSLAAFEQLTQQAGAAVSQMAATQIINRTFFMEEVKASLYRGSLSAGQRQGLDAILNTWQAEHANGDDRHLAYMLATTYHETDRKMQPIEEYGKGRNRPYGVPDAVTGKTYYGRGFVQLTHKYNYASMSQLLGVDLVNNPELALDLAISTRILFLGMFRGTFTGKKLSDYFSAAKEDWKNARRIINGTDRAEDIAAYARQFYRVIAYKP